MFLILLACTTPADDDPWFSEVDAEEDFVDPPDPPDSGDTADTSDGPDYEDLCTATGRSTLTTLRVGDDGPLDLDSDIEELAHYVDADSSGNLSYIAGTPGLLVVDTSSGTPVEVSRLTLGTPTLVHVLDKETLLLSDQVNLTWVVDVSDPAQPLLVDERYGEGVVAVDDSGRYFLRADGTLTDDTGATVADGLGSTRDLVVVDHTAYVLDRAEGVVIIDLPTGEKRTMATAAPPTTAYAWDGWLYVGLGSQGLQTFKIENPDNPTAAGIADTVGTVYDLMVAAGSLFAATVDGVATFSLSDPSAPVLVGHQPTPGFIMGLAPSGSGTLLADWNYVHHMQRNDDGPVLELSHRSMSVDGQGELVVRNPSALPLKLVDTQSTEGIQLSGMPDKLAPGEEAIVTVQADAEGAFCITSDDIAEPARLVTVDQGSGLQLAVGEPAPQLRLNGLDGTPYDLEEQRGRNVVLVFFNTWCAVCLPEVDDVLARSQDWDAEVWLVSPMLTELDDVGLLADFVQTKGIDLPVLVDPQGSAYYAWQVEQTEQALFPQNWVIGPDGTIVYASNVYQPEAIEQALQAPDGG